MVKLRHDYTGDEDILFISLNRVKNNMARKYSRSKGKSGSKKPLTKSIPSWIRYKPKEVELLIVKLGKEEKTSSEIGIILRDTYGIPDVKKILGKKITKVLTEKKLASKTPEDLKSLIKRAITIRGHLENNKQDMVGKRGLQLTESKVRLLGKYYLRTGRLPKTWKYSPEKAKIYIE